ncbi:MAG: sigma-70 family RNA polymerase sigma factor [Rhodospirillales bacterium]
MGQAGTKAGRTQPASDYEAALLNCAAGEQAALEQIYRNERGRLRAAALHIVRDRERAEDVIHDAFVQILRDAASFDPARGSARAWIYTIVRHTALKSIRRMTAEQPADLDAMAETAATPDAATVLADGTDLRDCLERLDPRRRACLILAIVDGRTHAEVAAYLGVPVGTVKSWIRRELVALRRRLS